MVVSIVVFFFFKQKTAYEMRISDWSSDVCSSDLPATDEGGAVADGQRLPDCRDNGAFIELCRIIYRRPAEQDGEAVKSSLTAAFKRGHGGFMLCKEGRGPGWVERCVEACTHPALGQRAEEHTSELQSMMRISYADF